MRSWRSIQQGGELLFPSVHQLVEAMTWAVALGVGRGRPLGGDDYLLTVRLRSLSDGERSYANRRLTHTFL